MTIDKIKKRLSKIAELKPGWYNGEGAIPEKSDLDWLIIQFELLYPKDYEAPYFYPTPKGGLLVEWDISKESISLEIDFPSHIAFWHQLNMDSNAEVYRPLDLNDSESWDWFVQKIRACYEISKT